MYPVINFLIAHKMTSSATWIQDQLNPIERSVLETLRQTKRWQIIPDSLNLCDV